MSVRVRPAGPEVDRPVLTLAVAAVVATALGALVLVQAAIGGRPDYRTVRVDNQAGLPVEVEVAGAGGGRLALGLAGAEQVREAVGGRSLAGRVWTFQIPDDATMELERQGYQ